MRILALLVLTLLPAFVAASEPTFETSEVFPPGVNGIAHYRIPGIVVTPKGTVLAYCEARKNNSSDWGEIEVHLRRSTDGGKTWLPSQHIAHHGERMEGNPRKAKGGEREQTVNNPVAIVDHQTGAIEFLYCVHYARCSSMRSQDDGVKWSEPVEITASFEPFRERYDWKVIATGPGHGLRIKSGRLVVPVWLAYGNVGDQKPSASGTICRASIVTHASKPGTLIFSNPHSLDRDESGKERPAGRGKRKNLSIKLSYDDGTPWPINKILDAGPSADSDLAVLEKLFMQFRIDRWVFVHLKDQSFRAAGCWHANLR